MGAGGTGEAVFLEPAVIAEELPLSSEANWLLAFGLQMNTDLFGGGEAVVKYVLEEHTEQQSS